MENKMNLQLFAEEGQGQSAPGGAAAETETGAENAPQQEAESPTRRHWQQVEGIYQQLMRQGEELKGFFPDFDLAKEVKDERFLGMLKCGVDMASAYQALHAGDILPAAMAYAARRTREGIAASMASGRPGENGLAGSSAVKMGSSVTAMTQSDYERICRMVERGERVSFG